MSEHLTAEELERLERVAEAVHNAWWEQSNKAGRHAPSGCQSEQAREVSRIDRISYGHFAPPPSARFCDKCHPDMIPYSELSEGTKEYDRMTAWAVVGALGDPWNTIQAQREEIEELQGERKILADAIRLHDKANDEFHKWFECIHRGDEEPCPQNVMMRSDAECRKAWEKAIALIQIDREAVRE